LGGLNVLGLEGTYKDVEFSVGTGFTGADSTTGERAKLWAVREKLIGRIAKVKYFASGSKDRPRFPVFLGWRDLRDL
jgi:DNA ligase-1